MMKRRIWIPEAPFVNLRRYVEAGTIRGVSTIEGFFEVELVHARTGLVKRRLTFPNLITDWGLDALFSANAGSMVSYLAVGTGSSVPDESDSELDAEVARTNNTGGFPNESGSEGSGDGLVYHWTTRTRVFGEGQANANLTELGFFAGASGGPLWNRQLFRDENGNPTTITKTSDDQLRVRYTWRVYPPMDDDIQEILVGGVPTEVTIRAGEVGVSALWSATSFGGSAAVMSAYSGAIRGRSSLPSGSWTPGSITVMPYVPGSFTREAEARWTPSQANYGGGVRSFGGGSSSSSIPPRFQMELSPTIPKTDAERLIVSFAWSIARHDPEA